MPTPPLGSIPETLNTGGSIKDAYCEWLHDVDALTRKRKGKKKSKRLTALRHLTQPTEASAKKQFQAPVIEPTRAVSDANTEARSKLDAQRRRFRSLADEANYAHFSSAPPLTPGLAFFELLAAQSEARVAIQKGTLSRLSSRTVTRREISHFPVQVPPTVLRQSKGAVLFFTVDQPREPQDDALDKVHRTKETESQPATDWTLQFHLFPSRDVFESRLPWILRVLSGNKVDATAAAIAIIKTASGGGNDVHPLQSLESTEEALRSLWEDKSTLRAVQTYIPSKGTTGTGGGKAWIARPAYRKKDQNATTVWILTGADALLATTEWKNGESDAPPCQIVKCTTVQSWQQPRVIVETLCQCLDTRVLRPSGLGAFAELIVDLVQDTEGTWWLLQVKAFQLRKTQLPPPLGRDPSRARSAPDRLETNSVISTVSSAFALGKVKWKCSGKYCHLDTDDNNQASSDAPSGYLTKKELLSCEFFDRYQSSNDASLLGGCSTFLSALLFYVQHQITKRNRTVLYEPQALCEPCLQQYYALRTAMASHIESDSGNQSKKLSRLPKASRFDPSKSLTALPIITPTPSQLPPLQQQLPLQLQTSQSTPAIKTQPLPSYMDELVRIEELLADGLSHKETPREDQEQHPTPERVHSPASPTAEPPAFSWQDRSRNGDRVEEMWQHIQLKPVKAPSKSHSYNSVTLETALRESVSSPRHPPPTSRTEPHCISLVDCRRVFADDAFRDAVVREATEWLLTHRQAVQFVVLPTDAEECGDVELGRLALRTLALDIDQSLTHEGVSGSSGLAPVVGDAANCGGLFMTVPVPPLQ